MTEKFLRLPDVEIRVGLRRSAIYEAMKENRFPKPIKLGIRAVAWAESEILCWQQAQNAMKPPLAGRGDQMPKPGKETKSEHWTKLIRSMMEEPAWRALSPTAQALYPWLKLEWRGPNNNNNGRICLSVRQAAQRLGVSDNTAAKAFHDLQAKGFIVQTETPCLGVNGAARGAMYELTELACNKLDNPAGRKLYKTWTVGSDFPVKIARANNPHGRNGKPKPHRKKQDVTSSDL